MAWRGALLATLASASTARADAESDLEGLLNESVITTASKSAEVGETAPATSSTLSAEDIRRYGIQTLDEALDFLSLGVVTQNAGRSLDVGARGVFLPNDRGSHFLLLVDGHAMNEPLFGTAQFGRGLGVPFELVDHIEVILGPGSVLYGSNAMLGVINVITKRAKDFHGAHVIGESQFGKSYRAAGGVGYALPILGGSELTLALEYFRQDGPSFFYSPQDFGNDLTLVQPARFSHDGPPTGIWGGTATRANSSEAPSGYLRFVAGEVEVNVGANAYRRTQPFQNQDFSAVTYFDDPDAYDLDRHLWADVKHRATLSPIVQLSTRLYGDSFDYQRYSDSSFSPRCFYQFVLTCRLHTVGKAQWAGGEVQASFDWLHDARLVTMLGLDGRFRSISTKVDTLDYDTGRNLASSYGVVDAHDETLGAYLQQTWQPTRWLALNGGARIDRDPRFKAVGSPRVAASIQPWRNGSLKAIYAEAFRAPTWGETSSSAPDQLMAQSLRPERVRSAEASIEQKFGGHRILFGAFRSWWEDLIALHTYTQDELKIARENGELTLAQNAGVTQYRNVASIDNYGFNATLDGTALDAQLRYALNVTGVIAESQEVTGASHPLAVAPHVFGNARVSYDFTGAWPTLALAAHYIGRRPADRAFDSGFDVWAPQQLEMRATISGPVPLVKGLSYRVFANWATSDVAAYFVGPTQNNSHITGFQTYGPLHVTLLPVDTFRIMGGLQWDILQ